MNTQYELITTPEELRRAVEQLATRQVICVDTETTDLDPYVSRLRLVQLATPENVFIIDIDKFADCDLKCSNEFASFRQLLSAARPIKIAHNSKFDAKFIKHNFGVD